MHNNQLRFKQKAKAINIEITPMHNPKQVVRLQYRNLPFAWRTTIIYNKQLLCYDIIFLKREYSDFQWHENILQTNGLSSGILIENMVYNTQPFPVIK